MTQMQIHQDSHPGHIPNGLSIIQIRSHHECNNSLWRTLEHQFFYSALTNTIYVGKTGALAKDFEGTYLAAFMLQDNRWLYSILPREFPINPHEVKCAICFVNDTSKVRIDWVEAYRLLEEFHHIAGSFVLDLHDLSMKEILKPDVYTNKVSKPWLKDRQLWGQFPICQNEDVFHTNQWNPTTGAGLPPLDTGNLLLINDAAQYAAHHG